MGVNFDAQQMVQLCGRVKTSGPRVGARAAQALRKTAFNIEADAKTLAPVDTGNLRSSIITAIGGGDGFGAMTATVTAEAEYSAYVEFGTSTQSGQPFMIPAFERRVPLLEEALGAIGETLLD